METKQSAPQVSDSALRLPGEPPELPNDILGRFPSLGTWMDQQRSFWNAAQQAMQDFASAVLDVQQIGGVLNVDGNNGSLYIKKGRGEGAYADPDTPFYVDTTGRFSLKNLLTWNPDSGELTVEGTIIADAGEIGGWIISPTTLSKNDAVLDSAGQLTLGTGNDIIILSATDATYRLWAGNATAGTATFSVTKLGALFSTAGTIGGFSIGTDYLRDTANSMGLASTVTGGDDVRFWAGETFANRATAPFRVTESGAITATSGAIGGWTVAATTLSNNNAVLDSAGQLALGTGNDIVIISATDATYRLWAGDATAASAAFTVTKSGVLTATGATISGSITATSGTIGGFSIGADYIRDTANSMGLASTVTGGDDVRFWAGDTFANRATAPFRVTEAGALTATNATITGTITATTGTIGGFNIGADYIRDAGNSFGLASTVTGGDDVRFWAGDTFANRASAPFRVTESGTLRLTGTGNASFVFDGSDVQISTNSNTAINSRLVVTDDLATPTWQGGTTENRGLFIQRAGGVAAALGMLTFNTSSFVESNIAQGAYGALTAQVGTGVGLLLRTKYYNGASWVSGSSIEIRNDASVSGTTTASSYVQILTNDTTTNTSLWRWQSTGRLIIGGTVLSMDTTLYRRTANTLTTDDAFECDSLVVANGATASTFAGDGASLTNLNASNIASGTLANGRLPTAISVTSLTASAEVRGATARFGTFTAIGDTPVIGWIDLTDAAGNARRLAVV